MNRRTALTAALLALAALAGVYLGATVFGPPAPVVLAAGTAFDPPRPLPAFDLRDPAGQPAGAGWFRGGWSLVFFGFTRCPEACPATLGLLGGVRRELAGELPAAALPRVVLVSVDPERDPPPVLQAYLAGFGPGFTGLTGEPAAVAAFAGALGVPYRKVPMAGEGDGGDYMMDHSTAILAVDPEGRLQALWSAPHTADGLVADLRRLLAAR